MYEKLELIPKVNRLPNGYRVFIEYYIQQCNLARTAFKVEILQNGFKKKIINFVKLSGKADEGLQEIVNMMIETDEATDEFKKLIGL